MEKFGYESLDEEHIRIIELLPGSDMDSIKCNLTSEPRRDSRDTYDAISYAWGDPKDTVEITCNNKSMSITASLAGALRTVRSRHSPHRLWADAICINQQRSHEKNHQVKRIGQVYENAREVMVWLGHDKDHVARECFNLIERWTLYLDEQLQIYRHVQDIPSFEPPEFDESDRARGLKLKALMSRSWFSRVWVVQEAGMAKECSLLWGNQRMPFATLIEFACFCNGRTNIMKLMGGDDATFGFWRMVFVCVFRTYENMTSWRRSRPLIKSLCEKRTAGLFLDVLQIGKSLSATDPRDHIYAFLGNPLAEQLSLEPDYERSEGDVYLDAASAILGSRHESPYSLCFVQHASADEVTGSQGPSWIPRWRRVEESRRMFYTIGNLGLSHKAGGPANRLQYRIDRAQNLLSVQGIMFDSLTWVSKPLRKENFALDPAQWDPKLRTSNQTHLDVLWNEAAVGVRNIDRYHDFSFTIVTGYNNPRFIKRREHRTIFKAYLKALHRARNEEPHGLNDKEACNASRYEVNARNCTKRCLAVTEHGRFALVPQFAQVGDQCCVVLGMVTPFVVRAADRMAGCYHLVGEAYVNGVMKHELVDMLDRGEVSGTEIRLLVEDLIVLLGDDDSTASEAEVNDGGPRAKRVAADEDLLDSPETATDSTISAPPSNPNWWHDDDDFPETAKRFRLAEQEPSTSDPMRPHTSSSRASSIMAMKRTSSSDG
ncbi:hypothetical protein ACEPPN_007243 [Leptodophora sp. 'Broadleaf-Isolate-01']